MIAYYHLDKSASRDDFELLKGITDHYRLPSGLTAGDSNAILLVRVSTANDARKLASVFEMMTIPFSLWYIL
ncbi:MAG: hypothetical protein ACYSUV_18740 [Planctomycetota bacterium]|jgi:hypothetical protein